MTRDEIQESSGGHWAGLTGTLILHILLIALVLLTNLRFEAYSLFGGAPPPPPPPLAVEMPGDIVDASIDEPEHEPEPDRRPPEPEATPLADPDPPEPDDIKIPRDLLTPTPVPTRTPPPTPTPEPDASPVATPTPRPSATPKPTATPKPAATPAPTKTPRPTPTATPAPKKPETKKPEPTRTPRATATPKPTPKALSAAELKALLEKKNLSTSGREKKTATAAPGTKGSSSPSARSATQGGRAGGVDGGVAGGKEGGVVGGKGMTLGGTGTGRGSGLPDSYAKSVMSAIGRHFIVPEEQKLDAQAAVVFTIRRDGTLTGARVRTSSGSTTLDALAIKALNDAKRVPPLPDSYAGNSIEVEVGFSFNE